jgi:isopenicillin N synthase-like dioxygenase
MTLSTEPLSLVPDIDVSPFLEGTPEGKQHVAAAVGQACEASGFLVIRGHGVAQEMIDDVQQTARDFFALPEAEKLHYRAVEGRGGYRPVSSSTLGRSTGQDAPPDLAEFYSVHGLKEDTSDHIWPEQPAAFKSAFLRYQGVMEQLAATMMRVFALALALDEDWFETRIDRYLTRLLANHYPAQAEPPEPGQIRLGQHSDFGTVTILYQEDAPGGLQILDAAGQWHDVPFVPGSFVVNIGDLLAMWTNDRWVSTVHRVVNPPREFALRDRLSLPFFQSPNDEAVIECIPTCAGPDNPPKYETVTAGEWIQAKLSRTYTS